MNLNELFESLRTENPCWKGYKPVGTKKKNGKTVPNCVPVNEGAAPNWSDLPNSLSMEDKISIFESYYANNTLLESDENSVDYFNSLSKFSSEPEQGKQYIVVPLMLIQNRLLSLNKELLKLVFVGRKGNEYVFSDGKTNKNFPSDFSSKQGLVKTFIFNSTDSYNRFRSAAALKFNLNLPDDLGAEGLAEAGPFSYGKAPRKGSVADLAAKKRKEQERSKRPIEPKDQMIGTAKVTKGVAEGKPNQLPTRGADYSQYDTDHLRTLLKPGILHRNEARFKALIRKELQKREQQGVAEGTSPFGNKVAGPFASEERAKREASRISKELGVKRYVEKTSDGKYIVVKKQGVAEGVTPASTSKVLRLIQRHHPEWFDNYGMGEVEDTVVDLADMGQFSGMSAADALELVGQELESLYGQQGVAEDDAGDIEQRMVAKIEKEKQRLAKLKQTDPEAYKREMAKRKTSGRVPPVSTFEEQGVAEGPGFDKWADERAASQLHKLNIPKTWVLNVMDEATGEHWAIEIQASNPDMAKERAQQQGYKVLRIREKGVAEGDKVGGMDADRFDAAMARLKQLAGQGPRKTVWDPVKRVYKTVPVAQQPGDKK